MKKIIILFMIITISIFANSNYKSNKEYHDFNKSFVYPEELHAKAKDFLYHGKIKEALIVFKNINEKYSLSKFNEEGLFLSGYLYNNDLKDTTKARFFYKLLLNTFPKTQLRSSVEFELKHLGKQDFFPKFKN